MQNLKSQDNKLKQKLKELSIFYEIEKLINSSSDLDLILEKIIKSALVLTNTKRGAIPLFDKAINKVDMTQYSRTPYDTIELPIPPIGKGIFWRTIKYNKPYLIQNAVEHKHTIKQIVRTGQIKSFICVPLTNKNITIGAIAVFDKIDNSSCNENDLNNLVKFSSFVTRAIINSQRFAHIKQQAEWLKTIEQITKKINSTLNFQDVLTFIVNSIVKLINVKICSIRLFDKKTGLLNIVSAKGLSTAYITKGDPKPGEGLAGKVFTTRTPIQAFDLKTAKGKYSDFAKKEGLCSYLCAPLIAKGKCIGVISVYTTKPHHFTKKEYTTLTTLTNTSAIAIENARLFKNTWEQTNKLKERHRQFKTLFLRTIKSLAKTLEAKDKYTEGHSQRVAKYSSALAKKINLSTDEIEIIRIASLLHDIGKIAVKDDVLNKPSKLTSEEYDTIKKHPLSAVKILKPISEFQDILEIIKYHHERIDGSGYPNALKGDEIPVGAKILALADSFDAMVSTRSYRPAKDREDAKKELYGLRNKHYDAKLTNAFLKVVNGN